jgi:divalent metal cation (Fe/Co/Zn/Cd) transporter
MHQLLGSPTPDNVAGIVIGVLLAAVGLRLAGRDRELLTNRSESRVVLDRIRDLLAAEPEVAAGGKVASVYIGPHQLMVTAEIQPLDALSGLRFGDSWLNSAGRWLRLIPRIATVFLTPAVAVEQQPELGP